MKQLKISSQYRANNIIITGTMGSGKTTLIDTARLKKIPTVSEPAREILAEQRCINGLGVPEKNPSLFCQLMLSRAIHNYQQNKRKSGYTLFDRAIPDIIAYAKWFSLDTKIYLRAAAKFRYNSTVFIAPPWQAIYKTDEERTMCFDEACQFDTLIRQIYLSLDYEMIELPKSNPDKRLEFMKKSLKYI